jgi:hypothetical protein
MYYVFMFMLQCIAVGTTPLYTTIEDSNGNTVRSVVGVYGIDLVISKMNSDGSISNADIMSGLGKISTCPAMTISDETLAYFRDTSASCTVDLETINYGEGGKFPMDKNKYKYDLIGSFGIIVTIGISLMMLASLQKKETVVLFGIIMIVIQLAFGIALVAYTLSTSWDDAMFSHYWKPSNMTILNTAIDPQICCNVVNCRCMNYYGSSCSSMVDSYTEGSCDFGYHCCATREESCNCDSDGHCQTCTVCTSSVNHRQCEVECLECYVGKATWYYQPEESSKDVVLEYKKLCDEGSEAASLQCAQDYVANYPVNSKHYISYNPLNLLKTSPKSTDLPGNYYAVIVSLTVMFLLSYCFLVPVFGAEEASSGSVAPAKQFPVQHVHDQQQQQQQKPAPVPAQQQTVHVHVHQQQPQQAQAQQQPVYVQQQPLQSNVQQPMYIQQPVQQQQQQPVYVQQQQPVYVQQQPLQSNVQQPMYIQQPVQQQPMYAQQQQQVNVQQPVYIQPNNPQPGAY